MWGLAHYCRTCWRRMFVPLKASMRQGRWHTYRLLLLLVGYSSCKSYSRSVLRNQALLRHGVGIVTRRRAGRSVIRIPTAERHFSLFPKVQTGSRAFSDFANAPKSDGGLVPSIGWHKKTGTFGKPNKNWRNPRKQFIDRNWTITTCLLRDSNPDYQCLKITSHSAEHATHTGWHKRMGTFEMRSGSERMHTWRRTPSTGRNFQKLIIWITVS